MEIKNKKGRKTTENQIKQDEKIQGIPHFSLITKLSEETFTSTNLDI